MLPPGTLKFLKGHPDAIVYVVLAAMAAGGAYAGGAWVGIAVLTIAGILYHLRCCAAEASQIRIEELKVENAALKVETVKARHREILMVDQPTLPLADPANAPSASTRTAKGKR